MQNTHAEPEQKLSGTEMWWGPAIASRKVADEMINLLLTNCYYWPLLPLQCIGCTMTNWVQGRASAQHFVCRSEVKIINYSWKVRPGLLCLRRKMKQQAIQGSGLILSLIFKIRCKTCRGGGGWDKCKGRESERVVQKEWSSSNG